MRSVLYVLAALPIWACSSTVKVGSHPGSGGEAGNMPNGGSSGSVITLPDASVPQSGDAAASGKVQNITSLRIDPDNGSLEATRGKPATTAFRAFARMEGSDSEVEITDRTAFWVTDNYLVGGFPSDGKGTFSVRIPANASDPPQRAGVVTVNAKAASSNGTITAATTKLTVKLTDVVTPAPPSGTAALPSDPPGAFGGTENAAYAPQLVYPNDGVLLPPNLGNLEVHWMPGSSKGTLYEVAFKSDLLDVRYYVRCKTDTTSFADNACVLALDRVVFDELAQTHRGGATVTLSVRASNESGALGTSKKIALRFAKDRVDGTVYYWNASTPPQIMRFDFGAQAGLESVLKSSDVPSQFGGSDMGGCVGCHILSHDGKHMAASYSGTFSEVYIADLSLPKTANNRLTVTPSPATMDRGRIVTPGSFDPTSKTFVMPAGDKPTALDFHDASTGLRTSTLDVGFNVAMPDWAPDDSMLAVTRFDGQGSAIAFNQGAIEILKKSGSSFALPAIEIVPRATGKNRYNGTFTPDSATLLFSESIQASGDKDTAADGYSDPSAKTWAVAAKAGATPVYLAKASAPAVADQMVLNDGRSDAVIAQLKAGNLMDTYPRPTPFMSTIDGHKLMWFTFASQRRAGVRRFFPNSGGGLNSNTEQTQTLLWMFALDADQLAAGKDGSYPGFFLPFQDFKTSNHMAQWTQKYVSESPPPPPPEDPPPPDAPPVQNIQ